MIEMGLLLLKAKVFPSCLRMTHLSLLVSIDSWINHKLIIVSLLCQLFKTYDGSTTENQKSWKPEAGRDDNEDEH